MIANNTIPDDNIIVKKPLIHHILIFTIIFIISIIPIISFEIIPIIDFYNHVSRYFILSNIDDINILKENYSASWNILPNLGLDLASLYIFEYIPPLYAAKLVLIIILFIQYSGVIALNYTLNKKYSIIITLLSALLLYSFIFKWGFANFLLATGLSLWGLSLWLWLRQRSLPLAAIICSVFALLIFFCHGFAFALYGITLALIELGYWLQKRPLRPASLFQAACAVAVQAIMPAIFFLLAPTAEAGRSIGNALAKHQNSNTLLERLIEIGTHQLHAIFRVANSMSLWLDVGSFLLVAALISAACIRGWLRINPVMVPVLLVMGLLSVITPPSLFGVGYISDRIPLQAALLLTAALYPTRPAIAGLKIMAAILSILLVVRLGVTIYDYSRYNGDFNDFKAVAGAAPEGEIVIGASPQDQRKRDNDAMRCEMYSPLMVPLYGNPTLLFANPTQQPLALAGRLARQAEISGERQKNSDIDRLTAAPQAGYEYYITCAYPDYNRTYFDLIARQGRFMLLKRNSQMISQPDGPHTSPAMDTAGKDR